MPCWRSSASAAQHGDQFERYDAWAKARTPPARCYLVALDGESLGAPDGWATEPSLAQLMRSWQDSSNPHAAWLALRFQPAVFEEAGPRKLTESSGPPPGRSSGTSWREGWHPHSSAAVTFPGSSRGPPGSQSAGRRRVLAWLPWPGPASTPQRLAVRRLPVHGPGPPRGTLDAAPGSRNRDQRPGPGRPGKGYRARPGRDDPRHAHLHSGAAGAPACGRGGPGGLPPPPKRNRATGLRNTPDAHRLSSASGGRIAARPGAAARHPVLYQDNFDDGGYRLASLIDVDVASLDRHQLARLMLAALGHMQAKVLHGAGELSAAAWHEADSAGNRTPAAS